MKGAIGIYLGGGGVIVGTGFIQEGISYYVDVFDPELLPQVGTSRVGHSEPIRGLLKFQCKHFFGTTTVIRMRLSRNLTSVLGVCILAFGES